jgi:hypothetical protein
MATDRSRLLRRCLAASAGSVTAALVVAGALAARQPAAPPPRQAPTLLPPPAAVLPPPKAVSPPPPALPPPPSDAFVPRAALEPPPESTTGPFPMPPELVGVDLNKQTDADVAAKSASCQGCHANAKDPHYKDTVRIGCTDCHGGRSDLDAAAIEKCKPGAPNRPGYCPAAPPSQNPGAWRNGSGNPVRSYTLLNHESPAYIRFVNPGDLRINHISCGTTNCHPKVVQQDRKSMMTHGCMLWGAALYNNGAVPYKVARHGEFYSMNGAPLRAQTVPPPTEFEASRGVIPFLDPLIRYEVSQPGNILRIFERGGKIRPEVGIPAREEDPGRPFLTRLSTRGLGTENRTDPVFIGLQKTRLFNPTLNMLGTNDQPGDYRSSGCTACHVIYANDRSPLNSSSRYAKYGHMGMASVDPADDPDPTIPKDQPGHPIRHRFAPGNAIPTSQCMVCHVHPGTTVMNSYIGYMWWDEETDGELMYPRTPKKLTAEEVIRTSMANPDEAAAKGNWSDPAFLANLTDLNPRTKHTYFGDFHSHGWVFRAVWRHDRKGTYLDYNGNPVELNPETMQRGIEMPLLLQERYRDPQKAPDNQLRRSIKGFLDASREAEAKGDHKRFMELEAQFRKGTPVHLLDVHLEKGMHCVDCHFVQDEHGNNRLQMEVRAAVEIQCVDCHGSYTNYARLRTSGPAAYSSNVDAPDPKDPRFGRDLTALRTPSGKPRFERRGNRVFQNSMVEPDLTWEVVQTRDTIDPASKHYNAKSAIAKTVRVSGGKMVWGSVPGNDEHGCAHATPDMTCQSCHSSWNPSCYGCHLPQKANYKMPQLMNGGDVTRNYTGYDYQTLRDDVFMLARDGLATGNRVSPARSSCAIHVSSFNNNREEIYVQQQTVSGEGFSGVAFSTNVPHTFSGRNTTKQCTDCHISKDDDNNAIMAQLLMQGTQYLNFMGEFCWVAAGEHGLFAVLVTEQQEPQAVIGSYLHKLAFPDHFEEHVNKRQGFLEHAHEHPGKDVSDNLFHPHRKTEVLAVQPRGEYLYAACGAGGVRAYDISMIAHKGFSERIFTAPVSPLGQRFYLPTTYCTAVAAPTTTAPDPLRTHYKENHEGKVAGVYGSIYALDKYEGLIVIGAGPLIDGDPLNNFLERQATFNPDGILNGGTGITIVGNYAYILCDKGLVVVSVEDPKKPVVKVVVGEPDLKHPHAIQLQFRYAYVADEEGIKVFDITRLDCPKPVSHLDIPDVHSIYVARTYAYLAAGKQGLVILDIENPAKPKVDQVYNAGGCINDLHDVKLAVTYTSEFAYLADGKNGMRIVQLTSPETPGNMGFSPRPTPQLIATYKIPQHGEALSVGKALDRDRAVDESGNQIGVFGRVGARPFNLAEQQRMYLRDGKVWKVSDDPAWEGYQRVRPGR